MNEVFLLKNKSKKVLKLAHLLLAATVLGGLAALLCILLFKQSAPATEGVLDRVLLKGLIPIIQYAFCGLVFTSLVFGLFTEWGVIKYNWILAKWAIVLALFALMCFGLNPAISGMASISDAGFYSAALKEKYAAFALKALVFGGSEFVLLIAVFLLSVFKPWGLRKPKSAPQHKLKKISVLIAACALLLLGAGFVTANTLKLQKIRNLPIERIDLSVLQDGIYDGEEEAGSYVYKVKVEVRDHRIVRIDDIDGRDSPYADYAKGVFHKIISEQRTDVDAISGATTTSKAYLKAVENALENRTGN